jgi:hypothetical protein
MLLVLALWILVIFGAYFLWGWITQALGIVLPKHEQYRFAFDAYSSANPGETVQAFVLDLMRIDLVFDQSPAVVERMLGTLRLHKPLARFLTESGIAVEEFFAMAAHELRQEIEAAPESEPGAASDVSIAGAVTSHSGG